MQLLLNIDTRKTDGKILLEYLQKLTYVSIEFPDNKEPEVLKSIQAGLEDVKNGNVIEKSISDIL